MQEVENEDTKTPQFYGELRRNTIEVSTECVTPFLRARNEYFTNLRMKYPNSSFSIQFFLPLLVTAT